MKKKNKGNVPLYLYSIDQNMPIEQKREQIENILKKNEEKQEEEFRLRNYYAAKELKHRHQYIQKKLIE